MRGFFIDLSTSALTISNNHLHLRVHGDVGIKIVLEGSSNLALWMPLQTNAVTGGEVEYDLPMIGREAYFLRARVAP
jgi:hypothetical protein